MSRRHRILWLVLLTVILGSGWYKSLDNRRDRQRQAAWQEEMDRLQAEQQVENQRLAEWLRSMHSQPDARQQTATELIDGRRWEVHREGEYEVARWQHPEYGIAVELDFYGDRLVASGLNSGSAQLHALHPRPPEISRTNLMETTRQFVVRWGVRLWLVALLVAVASRRFGLVAAEALLALALACGAAWLVSPWYSLTWQSIFSNDSLFFAGWMYLISIICLAFRVAGALPRTTLPRQPRFRLRSLLTLTGVVAVFLAMGPFGYVTLFALAVGLLVFFAILTCVMGGRPAPAAETSTRAP